ncbi:MAG: hypothetical protein KVP17_000054 [Porospora cf. gigantea B]|uniref:uncharacterized protein n=1 Tax=Porospora cf. gigantea B TaxID=2853592 RepID=UPI003571C6F9|nr:MAG: hypothetical protein KVP17_000054 [Porospora cf. gigantea B]
MLAFLLLTAFADRFGWFGDDTKDMRFVPAKVKPLFTAKAEDYDWFRWRPARPAVPATQSSSWTAAMSETEAPYSEAFYSADTSANPEADNLEGSTEPTTSDSTDNSTSETPEVPQVVASVVHVEASKVIVNEVTGASPASSKTHLLSIHTSLFASQLPSGVERVYVIKPPRGPTVKVFVHHSRKPRLRGGWETNKLKD